MHNKACHNMTSTHRTLIKALLDFNTVICNHNNFCVQRMASSEGKVGKKECKENIATLHSPNYLFKLFFCKILCPERQNYLKKLCFLFFLRSEKNSLELNILAKY